MYNIGVTHASCSIENLMTMLPCSVYFAFIHHSFHVNLYSVSGDDSGQFYGSPQPIVCQGTDHSGSQLRVD
jgi:hypothetical protein